LNETTTASGQKGLSIVNLSPDMLLKTLDPSLANDNTIILNAPAANVTKEVLIEPGQTYKINFDWASAGKTVDGTNLMLSFKNGGLMILRDFVSAMQDNLPPAMTLANGVAIDPSTLIVAACAPVNTPTPAVLVEPKAQQRTEKVQNIEPAAGETHHTATKHTQLAKNTADAVDPRDLANIEPAAGGDNSPSSGGRGGAGFASGIDRADLNGLNPLGPIAPTALDYSIPRITDDPASGSNTNNFVAPTPPPAPTLVTENERVLEDGSVALRMSTTAPVGTVTTITVSGIPAGWTVDPGLGTYNAATGVWKLVVPAGATFTGGPLIDPPADSDGDIVTLNVTATATSLTTGLSSVSTGLITVVTDAVADDPTLSAVATGGSEDDSAALSITTAPTDTDGSEVISAVYVRDLPAGFTLNKGVIQPDGSYLLSTADLAGLRVLAPANYSGTINIRVQTVVTETNLSGGEFDFTNNSATKTVEIPVTFAPVADQPALQVQDVTVLEDGTVLLPISAQLADRDGSEYLVVTVSGIPSDWGVTLNGGTYNASTGIWSITLPAGSDFTGGPILTPPANSDVDASSFVVIATSYEVAGGPGADILDTANVIVDAVADMPNLTVVSVANGEQDNPVLLNIASSLNDLDGSEVLSVVITGVPVGATLSAGVQQPDGSWLLTSAQLTGLQVIPATGYVGSFTLHVTSTSTESVTDGETILTNNVASVSRDIKINIARDDVPVLVNGVAQVDETNLAPTTSVLGSVNPQFGLDTGTVAPTGVASFTSGGSQLNGHLTSNGVPVVVTLVGNTYVGTAGTETVFTLVVNPNGTYTFTQSGNLDHADATNPNDIIDLTFGVTATDNEGDATNGSITIHVLDDAPIAVDEPCADVSNDDMSVSGNVLTNDHLSHDVPNHVTAVKFGDTTVNVPETGTVTIDGGHGVLVIAADGSYTYTLNAPGAGNDGTFEETLAFPVVGERSPTFNAASPNEGVDPDALDVNVAANGSVKILSETAGYNNTLGLYTITSDGTMQAAQVIAANVNSLAFGGTTNFAIPAGGQGVGFFLIADGFTKNAGYAGLDLSTGTLAFVYHQGQLDARAAKITDSAADISLVFNAVDGTMTLLQGPVYHTTDRDGLTAINPDGLVHTISGLADATDNHVLRIGFEDLPNGGDKDYSDVVFDFTYTPVTTETCDEFTYVVTDNDGDSSSATLCIDCTIKPDGLPTIGDVTNIVDETNLGPITVNGSVDHDFGTDGAGAVRATGVSSFASNGSQLGGHLTSNGISVVVTLVGNTYTGKAGDSTVFTLTVNSNGTYIYTQSGNLDHADATNPNDIIALNFGVTIADSDGDTDTGVITIKVKDDAPVAHDDQNCSHDKFVVTGNVLANDISVEHPQVTGVSISGHFYEVAAAGITMIHGDHGTLTIERDGDYIYTADAGKCDVIKTHLDPNACDVMNRCDPVITKNGFTISAIDPTNDHLLSDLTWVSGKCGENGSIGADGHCSALVNGIHEALQIDLATAVDKVDLTIGNLNCIEAKSGLLAEILVEGSNNPVTVDLKNGHCDESGVYTFTINGADFGGKISQVTVLAGDDYAAYCAGKTTNVSWTLVDVATTTTVQSGGGEDQFTYTVTDSDHDTMTALLSVCAAPSHDVSTAPTDCTTNVVHFGDDLTHAIDDFVCGTTVVPVCNTIVAKQISYEAPCVVTTPLDEEQQQAA
jgi:large repetitive protein